MGAAREYRRADLAESRRVGRRGVVCDLEVRQDLLLPCLHAGPSGHRLRDVPFGSVRVNAYGCPVMPSRGAVPVDVDEGVVEALRERDGGDIERVAL